MKIFRTYENVNVGTGDGCEKALRLSYLCMGTTEEINKVENELKQYGRATVIEVITKSI